MYKYLKYEGLVINVDVEPAENEECKYAVIFHLDSEKLFYLNETAYEILELCETPRNINEINCKLEEMYEMQDVDFDEILSCVNELVALGLLIREEFT